MNESEFLAAYDMSRYERPSVTADIAAFMMRSEQEDNYRKDADAHLSLLLIRRGGHPFLRRQRSPDLSHDHHGQHEFVLLHLAAPAIRARA